IYPKGAKLRPIPNLKKMTTEELVAALDSPNGWQRDTAQQLLVWRRDSRAPELLRKLIEQSKRPIARAQALWTLENLTVVSADDILRAFKDEDPRVQTQAIRVSELLKDRGSPGIGGMISRLAESDNEPLAFQAVLTMGQWAIPNLSKGFAK